MTDPIDDDDTGRRLSDRLLDLFVFLPTGLAVTVVEELPELTERGRERFGVHVNSARAVGKFAVQAGGHELKKRSGGLRRPAPAPERAAPSRQAAGGPEPTAGQRLRSIPRPPAPEPSGARPAPTPPDPAASVNGHIPDVATLAIPGFDTLSASQVVQRLDGLSRSELVSVRAYETSTRGRRTILSRVDQLLDERS
jgi:hypothetical protein